MTAFFDLLEAGDFCSLSVLLLIVFLAGGAMAGGNPKVHAWGRRLAAGAFIAYGIYGCLTFHPTYAEDWIGIGVRAAFCAGLALGLSWIMLSLVSFVYGHTVGPSFGKLRAIRFQLRQKSDDAKQRRAEENRRQQEQRDWERAAPERERLRQLQEEQQRKQKSDQNRREEARLECDLLYQRHASQLASFFPPERYEALASQHLSEEHAAEDVEQRAARLQQMIRDCLDASPGSDAKFKSLQEVAAYFDDRRKEIDNLPYDDDTKGTFRTLVNGQEEAAVRRFLSP